MGHQPSARDEDHRRKDNQARGYKSRDKKSWESYSQSGHLDQKGLSSRQIDHPARADSYYGYTSHSSHRKISAQFSISERSKSDISSNLRDRPDVRRDNSSNTPADRSRDDLTKSKVSDSVSDKKSAERNRKSIKTNDKYPQKDRPDGSSRNRSCGERASKEKDDKASGKSNYFVDSHICESLNSKSVPKEQKPREANDREESKTVDKTSDIKQVVDLRQKLKRKRMDQSTSESDTQSKRESKRFKTSVPKEGTGFKSSNHFSNGFTVQASGARARVESPFSGKDSSKSMMEIEYHHEKPVESAPNTNQGLKGSAKGKGSSFGHASPSAHVQEGEKDKVAIIADNVEGSGTGCLAHIGMDVEQKTALHSRKKNAAQTSSEWTFSDRLQKSNRSGSNVTDPLTSELTDSDPAKISKSAVNGTVQISSESAFYLTVQPSSESELNGIAPLQTSNESAINGTVQRFSESAPNGSVQRSSESAPNGSVQRSSESAPNGSVQEVNDKVQISKESAFSKEAQESSQTAFNEAVKMPGKSAPLSRQNQPLVQVLVSSAKAAASLSSMRARQEASRPETLSKETSSKTVNVPAEILTEDSTKTEPPSVLSDMQRKNHQQAKTLPGAEISSGGHLLDAVARTTGADIGNGISFLVPEISNQESNSVASTFSLPFGNMKSVDGNSVSNITSTNQTWPFEALDPSQSNAMSHAALNRNSNSHVWPFDAADSLQSNSSQSKKSRRVNLKPCKENDGNDIGDSSRVSDVRAFPISLSSEAEADKNGKILEPGSKGLEIQENSGDSTSSSSKLSLEGKTCDSLKSNSSSEANSRSSSSSSERIGSGKDGSNHSEGQGADTDSIPKPQDDCEPNQTSFDDPLNQESSNKAQGAGNLDKSSSSGSSDSSSSGDLEKTPCKHRTADVSEMGIVCTSNLILLGDEETTCTTFASPCKPDSLPSEFYPPGVRGQIHEGGSHSRHIRGGSEVLFKPIAPAAQGSGHGDGFKAIFEEIEEPQGTSNDSLTGDSVVFLDEGKDAGAETVKSGSAQVKPTLVQDTEMAPQPEQMEIGETEGVIFSPNFARNNVSTPTKDASECLLRPNLSSSIVVSEEEQCEEEDSMEVPFSTASLGYDQKIFREAQDSTVSDTNSRNTQTKHKSSSNPDGVCQERTKVSEQGQTFSSLKETVHRECLDVFQHVFQCELKAFKQNLVEEFFSKKNHTVQVQRKKDLEKLQTAVQGFIQSSLPQTASRDERLCGSDKHQENMVSVKSCSSAGTSLISQQALSSHTLPGEHVPEVKSTPISSTDSGCLVCPEASVSESSVQRLCDKNERHSSTKDGTESYFFVNGKIRSRGTIAAGKRKLMNTDSVGLEGARDESPVQITAAQLGHQDLDCSETKASEMKPQPIARVQSVWKISDSCTVTSSDNDKRVSSKSFHTCTVIKPRDEATPNLHSHREPDSTSDSLCSFTAEHSPPQEDDNTPARDGDVDCNVPRGCEKFAEEMHLIKSSSDKYENRDSGTSSPKKASSTVVGRTGMATQSSKSGPKAARITSERKKLVPSQVSVAAKLNTHKSVPDAHSIAIECNKSKSEMASLARKPSKSMLVLPDAATHQSEHVPDIGRLETLPNQPVLNRAKIATKSQIPKPNKGPVTQSGRSVPELANFATPSLTSKPDRSNTATSSKKSAPGGKGSANATKPVEPIPETANIASPAQKSGFVLKTSPILEECSQFPSPDRAMHRLKRGGDTSPPGAGLNSTFTVHQLSDCDGCDDGDELETTLVNSCDQDGNIFTLNEMSLNSNSLSEFDRDMVHSTPKHERHHSERPFGRLSPKQASTKLPGGSFSKSKSCTDEAEDALSQSSSETKTSMDNPVVTKKVDVAQTLSVESGQINASPVESSTSENVHHISSENARVSNPPCYASCSAMQFGSSSESAGIGSANSHTENYAHSEDELSSRQLTYQKLQEMRLVKRACNEDNLDYSSPINVLESTADESDGSFASPQLSTEELCFLEGVKKVRKNLNRELENNKSVTSIESKKFPDQSPANDGFSPSSWRTLSSDLYISESESDGFPTPVKKSKSSILSERVLEEGPRATIATQETSYPSVGSDAPILRHGVSSDDMLDGEPVEDADQTLVDEDQACQSPGRNESEDQELEDGEIDDSDNSDNERMKETEFSDNGVTSIAKPNPADPEIKTSKTEGKAKVVGRKMKRIRPRFRKSNGTSDCLVSPLDRVYCGQRSNGSRYTSAKIDKVFCEEKDHPIPSIRKSTLTSRGNKMQGERGIHMERLGRNCGAGSVAPSRRHSRDEDADSQRQERNGRSSDRGRASLDERSGGDRENSRRNSSDKCPWTLDRVGARGKVSSHYNRPRSSHSDDSDRFRNFHGRDRPSSRNCLGRDPRPSSLDRDMQNQRNSKEKDRPRSRNSYIEKPVEKERQSSRNSHKDRPRSRNSCDEERPNYRNPKDNKGKPGAGSNNS